VADEIETDIEALKAQGIETAALKPKLGVREKRIVFIKPNASIRTLAGTYPSNPALQLGVEGHNMNENTLPGSPAVAVPC
jgi:hypothetical protein